VSEEIKEESQVEGLQDVQEEGNTEREKGEGDKAIEISEDFAGELEDVEGPDEGEEDDGSGNESEVEDKAEDLDANEPHAVDEKLWGDQQGKEPRDSDDRLKEDHSSGRQQGSPEVTANENRGEDKGEKEGEDLAAATESDIQEDAPGVDEEQPGKQGAPIEDWIDEKETLNLLEDLQMSEGEAREGGVDDATNESDEGDLVDEEVESRDPFPGQEDAQVSEDAPQEDEQGTSRAFRPEGTDVEEPDPSKKPDLMNPDLHGGADQDHDGMAELSEGAIREDVQTREGNKRTRGGQAGENEEEWTVPDV
jgi:midasin